MANQLIKRCSKKVFYMHSEQVAACFECSHERVLKWVLIDLPSSMKDMVTVDAAGQGFNIDTDLIFPVDGVYH